MIFLLMKYMLVCLRKPEQFFLKRPVFHLVFSQLHFKAENLHLQQDISSILLIQHLMQMENVEQLLSENCVEDSKKN